MSWQKFRKWLQFVHLWAGLICAIVFYKWDFYDRPWPARDAKIDPPVH